jgi:hypothetical protein
MRIARERVLGYEGGVELAIGVRSRLINFVDSPLSVTYNQSGEFFVPFDPQGQSTIVDVTASG